MKNIMDLSTLLVEEDDAEIDFVRSVFDRACGSATVHVARSADEALAMLLRQGGHIDLPPFDLILLGANVSLTGAMQILAAKNADEKLVERPVLAITDEAHIAMEQYCRHLRLHGAIPRAALAAEIEHVLELVVEYWFKGYVDMLIMAPPPSGRSWGTQNFAE